MIKKLTFVGSIFRTVFYEVLKLFKCLLGAFLSLLCSSWEPPRREKYGFATVKSHFLKMMLFGALKLSMAFLDPSWLLLGPIWSQNGLENGPKKYPKVVQKMVQKTAPKMLNSKMILGSNLKPFSGQIASKTQQSKYARHTQSASDFIKRLKNVKLSSKSGFSPQELPN